MAAAADGDTVSIRYTGTLADGTTFDSSAGDPPIEFTIGQGQVVLGLQNAVRGMLVGEKRTATIPCDETYGRRKPELIQQVGRDRIPAEIDSKPRLQLQTSGPHARPIVVAQVGRRTVALDANYQLAGRDLTFAIELVDLRGAARRSRVHDSASGLCSHSCGGRCQRLGGTSRALGPFVIGGCRNSRLLWSSHRVFPRLRCGPCIHCLVDDPRDRLASEVTLREPERVSGSRDAHGCSRG